MAKKKSTWLSPKKQKALDEKKKRDRKNKIIMITLLSVATAIALGVMIMGIAMASRPYYADIEIEGYGTITVKLNDSEAPKTVANFVNLARSGFYDGLTIYRVLNNNMICGGRASGESVPSTIKGEFKDNGVENNLSHIRGTISMIRETKAGSDTESEYEDYYDTATSEFFILQRDNLELDGYYAAFGTVLGDGMDIVDRICKEVEAMENDEGMVAQENQPIIKSVTIRRSN